MSDDETAAVAVWPYVLVGAFVRVAAGAFLLWYATAMGEALLDSSTPVTFLAIGAGLGWYSHKVDRPMQRGEMLRFAGGVALVDLIFSVMIVVGPILWLGEELSMENVDLVLGGDGTTLTIQDLPWIGGLAAISLVMTFGLGMFFAWLWTRKLPRTRKVAR